MENPKKEGADVIYPPTVKPGDPEAQKDPKKGKLVRYTSAGGPVYEADMPGFVRVSEKMALADAKKADDAAKGKGKGK